MTLDVPESPYLAESQVVIKGLEMDPGRGLTRPEAQRRLEHFGSNELRGTPPVPLWQRVVAQLKDPLVILLILAALISGAAWLLEGAHGAPIEAIVVLLVVTFNVGIGLVQESRAADAVAALAKMTQAHSTVIRDGELWDIPAADVVPGDLLQLAEGDEVGADARLLAATNLRIAEASLTGESTAVEKNAGVLSGRLALGDRANMVYKGTAVTGGTGRAVVTATGMDTEMGSIATMLDRTVEEETPLQLEINRVGSLLGRVVVAIAVIIMLTIALLQTPQSASDWVTILLLGVSLAVAAVPEGLPAVLSVVLALGVQRMAKRNAVVKKLSSAETLGSASVICTDKTGTLTQNEMTMKQVVTATNRKARPSSLKRMAMATVRRRPKRPMPSVKRARYWAWARWRTMRSWPTAMGAGKSAVIRLRRHFFLLHASWKACRIVSIGSTGSQRFLSPLTAR